jgi:hypothetical protein
MKKKEKKVVLNEFLGITIDEVNKIIAKDNCINEIFKLITNANKRKVASKDGTDIYCNRNKICHGCLKNNEIKGGSFDDPITGTRIICATHNVDIR